MGAQLSEVLNAEVTSSEEGGISRRRVVKGVAWSVPVIVAAVGAPPASASPGPTPTITPASGLFTNGLQSIPSTVSSAHDRSGVSVPATLSLRGLGGVTGSIQVALTISPDPAAAAAPTVSFSTVRVGSASVTVTPSVAGNKFTANFSQTLPAGATTLDFLLSGYSYTGKKQDTATYTVTTLITFQQQGKTVQLNPTSAITLVKL
jgi:hypothetical protein